MVVGMKMRHDVSGRHLDAFVHRAGDAATNVVDDFAGSWNCGNTLQRAVGGAAVYKDVFDIGMVLCQHRFNGLREVRLAVPCACDH